MWLVKPGWHLDASKMLAEPQLGSIRGPRAELCVSVGSPAAGTVLYLKRTDLGRFIGTGRYSVSEGHCLTGREVMARAGGPFSLIRAIILLSRTPRWGDVGGYSRGDIWATDDAVGLT